MKRPLFIIWIGLVLGEACGNLFHGIGVMIPASLFLFLFLYSVPGCKGDRKRNEIRKPFFIPMLCITMAMLVGVISWNMELKKIEKTIHIIDQLQENNVVLCGKVLEYKKSESGYSSVLLKNMEIKEEKDTAFRKLSGRGRFVGKIEESQKITPGVRIQCIAKLSYLEGARNPGGFDEKKYSYANGIYYSGFLSSIEKVVLPKISILSILDGWKKQVEAGYFQSAKEKEAAFLCAMVVGDKSYLSEEQKRLYEENGVAHMLAISGLHVSMVGGKLYRMLRKRGLGYTGACLSGGLILLCYGAITGFHTSAIRAILMYLIFLTAEYTGMHYDLLSSMSLSGIMMIIESPYRLLEGGFLISYVSLLSIGGVIPLVFRIFLEEGSHQEENHWRKRAKQALISSAVICITTLPLILSFYYECAPYSILLNPLILPFMGALMTSGILTGLAILFSNLMVEKAVFARPFLWIIRKMLCFPAVLILKGYEKILSFFRRFPGALWVPGHISVWKVILLYLLGGSILWLFYKKREFFARKLWIRCSIMIVSFLFSILLIFCDSASLRITMLDVGQGECILFRLPSGQTILLDGGSTSKKEVFEKIIEPALKYYGITHLDYVIVTHMDEDHISGIEEMLGKKYPVKNLLLGDVAKREDSNRYQRILQRAKKNRTKVKTIAKGTVLKLGDTRLHCLHPTRKGIYENENATSVVIHVKYGDFRALFTGDLEMEEEKELTFSKKELPVTLLKAAHHGSKYSTGKEFLEKIRPGYTILSAGKGNRYGHPHKELLKRLKEVGTEVHQTIKGGAVFIETDGRKTVVKDWISVK